MRQFPEAQAAALEALDVAYEALTQMTLWLVESGRPATALDVDRVATTLLASRVATETIRLHLPTTSPPLPVGGPCRA